MSSRKFFFVLALGVGSSIWPVAPAVAEGEPPEILTPASLTESSSSSALLDVTFEGDFYDRVRGKHLIRLLDFPISGDQRATLELERFSVDSPATRIVLATLEGEIPVSPPEIRIFKGRIMGRGDSEVILALSPFGCEGVIYDGEMEFFLVRERKKDVGQGNESKGGKRLHRLQSRWQLELDDPERECQVLSDDLSPAVLPPNFEELQKSAAFKTCRLALECDYEFWSVFNDMNEALTYIYTLFGIMSPIYERDVSVKLALHYIRIWTTASDPYSYVGGASTGLQEFQNYWNANHSTPGNPGFIERDLAHLLSSRPVGAWANTATLCDYSNGYAISGGNAGDGGFAHDIIYAGHEIGHNFDGKHTHCFDPPIDKCGTDSGCNDTVDCSTAPGTIMSYCKNCPGGVLYQFHALNIARMRTEIDGSCLGLSRNPLYVDWRNSSGTEDGTWGYPYNTVAEGTWFVIPGGTVTIADGSYDEDVTFWQKMTVKGETGTVVIGQ
jgi:hypothetical protein